MLTIIGSLALLVAAVGGYCLYLRRSGESWVNFFGTVLVVISLLYSAGHAALHPDRSTDVHQKDR
jgi:hypothetical protein